MGLNLNLQGPLSKGVILILLTLAAANADKQCSLQCKGSPGQVFKYEAGTNYRYKLEGTTLTKVKGSQEDSAKLTLSAIADVTADTGCGFLLALSDVHLSGPDGKKYAGAEELQSKPVRFSMENGVLAEDMCTEETESATALNVKRAVITLLQSGAPREPGVTSHAETDIFGLCPTTFQYHKSGGGLTVKKTKKLNKCYHREDLHAPLFSTPYHGKSDVQSTPVMDATYESEHQIVDGIVKTAKSKETYRYDPLSQLETGIKTVVQTKLTFVSKGAAIGAPGAVLRKSVIFEAAHDKEVAGTADWLVTALREAAAHSATAALPRDAAHKFSDLVRAFNKASKTDLLSVYNKVKSGAGFDNPTLAKEMFMGALLGTETSARIEVVVELLKSNELSHVDAQVWKIMVGYVKHVSKEAVRAITTLFGEGTNKFTYLGAGVVAGKFCRDHDCSSSPEIAQLEAKLAEPLKAGCKPATRSEEDLLLASMKGLGSARFLTEDVAVNLVECATDKSARIRVRAAAIDAIKTDPANHQIFKPAVTEILKDVREDAELRIKAYQVLMTAPCPETASLIKQLLDTEPTNQVGAYIVSHLRNLKASTNPEKFPLKQMFEPVVTTKRFPFDIRKYSQNHEFSYLLETVNMGATAESDVIYSQKSFVPRSLSLNLTTHLFGRSFNWLELNARIDNLDKVLESHFGPRGYMKRHEPDEMVSEGMANYGGVVNSFQERYKKRLSTRATRSVSRKQLEALENKVKKDDYIHDNQVDLDLSLKMEGADLVWLNYHSGDQHAHPNFLDNIYDHVDDHIEQAKDFDVDWKRFMPLIDVQLNYPTGMGVAMKLNVFGTVATSVKMDGKIDLESILKDPDNTDFKLQIIPSVAIDVSGTVSMDAGLVEKGVRLALNVHSATGSDISVRLLNGRGFDVKLGVPLEKTELISAETQVVNIVRETGHTEVATPVNFDENSEKATMCLDQMVDMLGVELCGEMVSPGAADSPLYGTAPFTLAAWIHKQPDLTHYHFKLLFDLDPEAKNMNLEVLMNTPNTKIDRKMNLALAAGMSPKPHLNIEATVPSVQAKFEGSLIDSAKEKTVVAKFNLAEEEYSVKAGVKVSGQEPSVTYEPFLEYKAPQGHTSGKLVGRKGAKQSQQQYYFSGAVKVKTGGDSVVYLLDGLSLHTPNLIVTANGEVVKATHLLTTAVVLGYGSDTVNLDTKFDFRQPGDIHVLFGLLFSAYPDFSHNIRWDLDTESDPDKVDSVLVIVHGPDPNSQDTRLTLKNFFSSVDEVIFTFKNYFSYPVLDLEASLDAASVENSFYYQFMGRYSEDSLKNELDIKWAMESPIDYDIHFHGGVTVGPVKKWLDVKARHDLIEQDKSKFANSLELHTGTNYQLNAVVLHKMDDVDDYELHIDCDLVLPTEPADWKIVTGVKESKGESTGLLKVSGGDKSYLDFNYLAKETPHPSFNYNLVLADLLKTDGDFIYTSTNLKANWNYEFLKYNKKMDAKADIKINEPKYVGFVQFCWDTSNREKTLKIETDTMVTEHEFNTKNTIHYKKQKSQLNVKGKTTGSPKDGSISGEIEVVLPNTRQIVAKVDQTYLTEPGDQEGELSFELLDREKAGAEPTKISLKMVGKNIDWQNNQLDGQASLGYTSPEHKTILAQATLKKMPDSSGKKWTINGQFDLSGSLIENPTNMKLESEVSDLWLEGSLNEDNTFPPMNFQLSGSVGQPAIQEWSCVGKLNGHLATAELTLHLGHLEPAQTFKWTTTNNIFLPGGAQTDFKLKTNNAFAWNGDKFFKSVLEVAQEGNNGGKVKLEWESESLPKRSLAISGSALEGKGDEPDRYTMIVSYDLPDGKHAEMKLKVDAKEDQMFNFQATGVTQDSTKYDVQIKGKVIGNGFQSDLVGIVGKNKYNGHAKFELHENFRMLDLGFEQPDGRSRILIKATKKGEKHFATEVKLRWPGEHAGSLTYDSDVNVADFNNMLIKANADSALLKLEKFQFTLATGAAVKQQAKKGGAQPGHALSFSAKNAGKNLFAGSVNYHVKKSDKSATYEGSGNMKINDKSQHLTFKAYTEDLSDGELLKLTITSGKRNFNAEYKRGKDELKMVRTYCKEGTSACSTARIHLFRDIDENHGTREAKIDILADLSLWSKDMHDVSFVGHAKRADGWLENLVHFKWSPTGELKYTEYLKPNEAGIVFVLPGRTIEAAANYQYGEEGHSLDTALWLDKINHPDHKTTFSHNFHIYEVDKQVVTETKFAHPKLARPMLIEGKFEWDVDDQEKPTFWKATGSATIDIFREAAQAILIEHKSDFNNGPQKYLNSVTTVKSTGCGIDVTNLFNLDSTNPRETHSESKLVYVDSTGSPREFLFSFEGPTNKRQLLWSIPNHVILKKVIESTSTETMADMTIHQSFLGSSYIDAAHIDKSSGKITTKFIFSQAGANRELVTNIDMYKNEVSVQFNGKQVLQLHVENRKIDLISPINDEALTLLIDTVFDELKQWNTKATEILEELTKKLAQEVQFLSKKLSEALPDLKPVAQDYADQIKQIYTEILSDEYLNRIFGQMREVLSSSIEATVISGEQLVAFYQEHSAVLLESLDKLAAVVRESTPPLLHSASQIQEALLDTARRSADLASQVFSSFLRQFKDYEQEAKMVADTAAQLARELDQLFMKFSTIVYSAIKEFYTEVGDFVREAAAEKPILDKISEMTGINLDLVLADVLMTSVETMNQYCSDEPICRFLTMFAEYTVKMLKKEPFDRKEAAEKLKAELTKVTKAFEELVDEASQQEDTHWLKALESLLDVPDVSISDIPSGMWRLSLLNWLQSDDLPSLDELLKNYNPFNWLEPFSLLPPYTASSVLMVGGELVTFDGKLVKVRGTCSYLLAEDFADGNFSLAATFHDGNIQSLTLFDRHLSIEIKPNHKAIVDGAEVEFPVIRHGMTAWRNPTGYGMYSDAGLLVHCDEKFSLCAFKLSGYYHNRVKGLLGNPNYEPHDDTATSHGTIARDSGELLNSWKLNEACDNVPPVPDVIPPREKICTDFFSDSTFVGGNLELCFFSVPVEPFRKACDRLAGGAANPEAKRAAACTVASAYAKLCRQAGNPFSIIPDECVTCQVGNEKLREHESKTITTPGTMADVIFVVELDKKVETLFKKLMVPLSTTLIQHYKERGITDVKVAVVGYGGEAGKWPAHFTTDGKIEFHGNVDNIHFSEKVPPTPSVGTHPSWKTIESFVNELFGNTAKLNTYESILHQFNFRPEAVKTVIGLDSDICDAQKIFNLIRTVFNFKMFEVLGVSSNYVYPFKVTSDDHKNAFVVGFDDDTVYTLADAKRKALRGLAHAADDLTYEQPADACVYGAKNMGNVFAGGNFADAKPGQDEQFISVMSQMIVESSMKEVQSLECTCALSLDFLRPRTYCLVDEAKRRPTEKAAIKSVKGGKGKH